MQLHCTVQGHFRKEQRGLHKPLIRQLRIPSPRTLNFRLPAHSELHPRLPALRFLRLQLPAHPELQIRLPAPRLLQIRLPAYPALYFYLPVQPLRHPCLPAPRAQRLRLPVPRMLHRSLPPLILVPPHRSPLYRILNQLRFFLPERCHFH